MSFGSERFQVPVIIVDQLSADVIGAPLTLVTEKDQSAPEDHSEPVVVSLVKTVQVPPMSEMEVGGEVKQLVSGDWVVERVTLKASVVVARAVVCPGDNHGVCTRVINPTTDIVTLYKGTKVATLEWADDATPAAAIKQGSTYIRHYR